MHRRLTLAVTAAAVALTACSNASGDTTSSNPRTTAEPRTQPAPDTTPAHSADAGSPATTSPAVPRTAPQPDVNTVDQLTGDIPQIGGLSRVEAATIEVPGTKITNYTAHHPGSVDDVRAAYATELAAQGWELERDSGNAAGASAMWTRGTERADVNLVAAADGTTVSVHHATET